MKRKGILAIFVAALLLFAGLPLISAAKAVECQGVDQSLLDAMSETESAPVGDTGVVMTQFKIPVGSGEYDILPITNYRIGSPKEAVVIFTGQSLTYKFYEELCIQLAQAGKSVYVIDRREANVPMMEDTTEKQDLAFMQDWTVESTLQDYSLGVKLARLHTAATSHTLPRKVKVIGVGHSLGGTLLMAYSDSSILGRINERVVVDTIIAYDPAETELIEGQEAYCDEVRAAIADGTFYARNMKNMIGLGWFALSQPEGMCTAPGLESFKNIEAFRFLAGNTYLIMTHPYTGDYCYWVSDASYGYLVPLPYVDEQELLSSVVLEGGAVPYSPNSLDLFMSELMVGQAQINPNNFANAEYVGIGRGFGIYGEKVFSDHGCPVQTVSNEGHGAIFSSQDVIGVVVESVTA